MTASWEIKVGDCREVLAALPDRCVHTVVTSPPYFGLRDYGTGEWDGGNDAGCDHVKGELRLGMNLAQSPYSNRGGAIKAAEVEPVLYAAVCGKCGATREDKQIGLEPTPDEYAAEIVAVFREVRRVLRDDGIVWLNLGDCYATGGGKVGDRPGGGAQGDQWRDIAPMTPANRMPLPGLKAKDLIGIPWLVAQALREPYYAGTIKDERDRVWLAATIDAEGCMFIHKRKVGQHNGNGYYRKNATFGAGLEVSSTDRCVVERIMRITGRGSICSQSPEQNERRKQTIYRWNLRTNECRDVIREVYPHLVAKQHEARLTLGCPSSGPDAERAHESLKAIHQGGTPDIDFAEPASMFEGGWCLRSEVIWAKLAEPHAREHHRPTHQKP